MEEDHKTKEGRDEGVEKHLCQIQLRGAHLKLVYYNGKHVLRAYIMVHVTTVLHVSPQPYPTVEDSVLRTEMSSLESQDVYFGTNQLTSS
jgi:hypothetical protein